MRPDGALPIEVPDPDQQDVFALRVQSVIQALGLGVDYDRDAFALRLNTGSVSWLGNRFDEWRHAPTEQQEGLLLHVAQGIVEASQPTPVPDQIDLALPHLRPRIRQRAHLIIRSMQLEADGMELAALEQTFVPLTTDLGAEVVFDTPTNIVSVPAEQLDAWGLDAEEALAIAIDNLRDSDPDPFRDVGDGVWMSTVGDCYDSARLLLFDEIHGLGIRGDAIALPANRDTLAITGADNLGGLYSLLQLALEVLDRPRMDTLQPVVLRGQVWVDWLPGIDHPMREAFYELAVRTRGTSYAEVKDLMESHPADPALFVASYGMMRPKEGDLPWSHSVWPPVRGWLPESDLVSVVHPHEQRYAVVSLSDLVAVVGHRLDPVPGVHPPYLAFDGVPDAREWEGLLALALFEGELTPSG